ncbi:Transcription factor tga2 [Thalictrum thalictroides]|uniref:Transcription factor tga2 n=1 Tax=Thalictrum thalictroides TaxID=46969 RepID=A0A7J6VAG2_THATH|nr:Transcription factor tga2 [Thalictrum thalictroides]
MTHTLNNRNAIAFTNFFEDWLVRQEHFLDELLCAESHCERELRELISRVLSHYRQYYEEKSMVTQNDVFLVLSPTWFSSFERSFLWLAGFKPALVFKLVANSVKDLSEEQAQMVERLKGEVHGEEIELEKEMAMVQESVAAPPLLEMARRAGRLIDGERREVDNVIESLKNSMQILVERADFLRVNTTSKVIEILSPLQGVKLLAATAQLQLRVRKFGSQQRQQNNR